MKRYEVTVKEVRTKTIEVDAEDADNARFLASKKLEHSPSRLPMFTWDAQVIEHQQCDQHQHE